MKAEKWLDVYNAMPRGLGEGDQFTLIHDLEFSEQENAAQTEEIKRLREALEKIEHNGCTEDAHIARTALAPQDAPEEGGS
jgi:hypothetical protein